jgi:hypothetical protein
MFENGKHQTWRKLIVTVLYRAAKIGIAAEWRLSFPHLSRGVRHESADSKQRQKGRAGQPS